LVGVDDHSDGFAVELHDRVRQPSGVPGKPLGIGQ